jgi:hypothetical protein
MSDRAKYWAGLVAGWEQSGLTQAEFCRRRGVKAGSFAWWKRKLGGTNGRAAKPARRRSASGGDGKRASFVEIGLSSRVLSAGSGNAFPSAGYEIVLPHGVVVRVPGDFDPGQVTGLLRAVASAC